MIEILKDTDRRLVITLGPGNKRRARFVLDRDSGQAWFERRSLLPSRTVQMPLTDITAIEAAGRRLIIVLKSGARHVFAGDPDGVRDAAAKMRGFVGLEGAASVSAHPRESGDPGATRQASDLAKTGSPQAKQSFGRFPWGRAGVGKRTAQVAAGVVVLALLILAGLKILDFFILPGCDAQRTRDTLHDLLQKRAQGPIALTDFSTISRTKTEYRCSADIAVNGDHATVGYRSTWDGFSAMVRVTGTLGTARQQIDPIFEFLDVLESPASVDSEDRPDGRLAVREYVYRASRDVSCRERLETMQNAEEFEPTRCVSFGAAGVFQVHCRNSKRPSADAHFLAERSVSVQCD